VAKIRYGPTIADVRGSIGALSYSRNMADHYIATRSPRAASLTANATTARATLSAAAQAWRDLNSSQRTAWNTLAATPPETDYDPWATQKYLTGFAWFVRVYARQNSTGETLPTDPPTDEQPDPPTITDATVAAYGSADDASYVTFTSPQPNLVPNGGFEAPYTGGVADQWTATNPARLTPSEETIDVYQGASAQKATFIAGVGWANLTSAYFPTIAHSGYWVSLATKIIANRLYNVNLYTTGGFYTNIFPPLTNPAWTLNTKLITPPATANSLIYATSISYDAATILFDACKITAPEHFILSAAINPSPGRQTPDHSYRLLHAGFSTTPTTISIGDALDATFGAYPAGWTLFLKLERQTISGLRSTPALFTTVTG